MCTHLIVYDCTTQHHLLSVHRLPADLLLFLGLHIIQQTNSRLILRCLVGGDRLTGAKLQYCGRSVNSSELGTRSHVI